MPESCQDVPLPQTPKISRNRKRGFTLLASLVAIMALASLTTLIQMRAISNQRLAARLTADVSARLAEDALHERLRGLIADQMVAASPRHDRPGFNGTPFAMEQNGRTWMVAVQDQEGLVDLYMAPPEILRRILPNAENVLSARELYLSPKNRPPRLEMIMTRLDFPKDTQRYFSQKSSGGQVNLENAPVFLRKILDKSPLTHLVATGRQTRSVLIKTSTSDTHNLNSESPLSHYQVGPLSK